MANAGSSNGMQHLAVVLAAISTTVLSAMWIQASIFDLAEEVRGVQNELSNVRDDNWAHDDQRFWVETLRAAADHEVPSLGRKRGTGPAKR